MPRKADFTLMTANYKSLMISYVATPAAGCSNIIDYATTFGDASYKLVPLLYQY